MSTSGPRAGSSLVQTSIERLIVHLSAAIHMRALYDPDHPQVRRTIDRVIESVVVSFEHHLRFDGQPNYPLLSRPRRPCLASQLTALADTYDAICTHRAYQRAKGHVAAMEVLKQRAGGFHDPLLVGNLERVISWHRSGTGQ